MPNLATLADEDNFAYTRFRSEKMTYMTPVFLGQSHKIWGLTALVLHEVLRAIIPEVYSVRLSVKHI